MVERFDFHEVIDRREVPALKVHRMVLGNDGMDLFPAGVADMDFRAPKPVLGAMAQRLAHGVFGYETVPDGLMPALIAWMKQRHAWDIPPDHILRAPNVLNSLSMAANLFTRTGDGIIVQPPVFLISGILLWKTDAAWLKTPWCFRPGAMRWTLMGWQLAPLTRAPRCCSYAIRIIQWAVSGPRLN